MKLFILNLGNSDITKHLYLVKQFKYMYLKYLKYLQYLKFNFFLREYFYLYINDNFNFFETLNMKKLN